MTLPWKKPKGLPAPCRIEVTWLVREAVSVALDWEEGGGFGTSVYYYAERLPPSEEEHAEYATAIAEVKRLLSGGWRDQFDEQTLAVLDEQEKEKA